MKRNGHVVDGKRVLERLFGGPDSRKKREIAGIKNVGAPTFKVRL